MAAITSPISPPALLTNDKAAPNVLTVAEIARELRCSKAHVHNIIAGKVPGLARMPALHLGRRTVVRRASFEAWMEANEHAL